MIDPRGVTVGGRTCYQCDSSLSSEGDKKHKYTDITYTLTSPVLLYETNQIPGTLRGMRNCVKTPAKDEGDSLHKERVSRPTIGVHI